MLHLFIPGPIFWHNTLYNFGFYSEKEFKFVIPDPKNRNPEIRFPESGFFNGKIGKPLPKQKSFISDIWLKNIFFRHFRLSPFY